MIIRRLDPFFGLDKEECLKELNLTAEQEEVMKKYLPEMFVKPQPISIPTHPKYASPCAPTQTSYTPALPIKVDDSKNQANPERAIRKKKEAKERELMRTFGNAYIADLFADKDLEYELRHNKKGSVIYVRIKDNKWAEFRLTLGDYDKYMAQLNAIPGKVAEIKALYEDTVCNFTVVKHQVGK